MGSFKGGSERLRYVVLVGGLLASVALVGCRKASPPEVAAPWSAKPSAQWPQLVLTNRASFRDRTGLSGASAFLVESSRGHVAAATALHLLGKPGGVEPPLPVTQLDQALDSWRIFPRTQPELSVALRGVAFAGLGAGDRDWLVLSVHEGPLPATPLRLRRRPVEVGEKVHLLGCPYSEPDCRQNVYSGKVTERYRANRWRFDVEPLIRLPGFSGAPIVDEKGLVVGVMTVAFDPRKQGDLWTEAGGEDVGPVFDALEQLPSATKPP